MNRTIKVIGVGQSLRGDDAAGIEAVRFWQATYLDKREYPEVQIELAELPGIDLLNILEGAEVAILVDSIHCSHDPGSIRVLSESDLDAFTAGSASAHGWGVAETLSVGRQLTPNTMPKKLILIGIEAWQLDLGKSLSPGVRAALPEAARLIDRCIQEETGHG